MSLPRYRLEQLEVPTSLPGFTIRRYQPGDERGILEAFNHVFAVGNPSFVPRTLEHWRWQFDGNPEGKQIYVAIHDETGAVAGHYAGLPRLMRSRDRSGIAAESVDSFVDSRFRAGLRRPGLFVVMALRWFHDFGDSGNLFAYGLPIATAARIGSAFLTYQTVHHQLALERSLEDARPLGGPAAPFVSEVSSFDDRFGELWERTAPELGVASVRGARYLNWRFRDHPTWKYRIGVVGDDQELRGYAVVRRGWFDDRDEELIVDFLCPKDDIDAARSLLRWAVERGREDGARKLTAILPPTSRWFAAFQKFGFLVRGTKYDWSVAWEKRPLDPYTLRREWWYTLADTDLA